VRLCPRRRGQRAGGAARRSVIMMQLITLTLTRLLRGLCTLVCARWTQYDVDAMRAFAAAFPTYRYRDGYDASIEYARGVALRYTGPYAPSEGRHERGYVGLRAADDMASIMAEVAKGFVIGPLRVAPFPVMKLNGRLRVPKVPNGTRWCLNGSTPLDNSVNLYCAARHQVFVPMSSTQRVAGGISDGKARMHVGQPFGATCDD
jgi:hypothetical protein